MAYSTNIFVGLIGVYTSDDAPRHGCNVINLTSSIVNWAVSGKVNGPDCHGSQPRWTLNDNYFGISHHSSSGANPNQPNHLDGYTRWNNTSDSTDLWTVWTGVYYSHTGAIFVGWKQASDRKPRNAYVENFGTHVWPESLYVGQLKQRLGYEPAWIEAIKEDYENFFETNL